jgi:hypothetical protein
VIAAKKYFTPEQADAMLPLVRSIVKDIAELAPSVRDRHERLKRLQRGGVAKGVVTAAQLEEEEAALEHDRERLEECLGELSELGVEMKDPFVGLIDFPCWKDGREIYLCWKLGESSLGYWHEVNAGFAGRRPL